MATVTGEKITTLAEIVRQIIMTRQALKKRLTELAAPVAAAIEAAEKAAGKNEKAAARKAVNSSHKEFLVALGKEATEAFEAAKQLAADAASVAEENGEEEVAASWDWHKGCNGRKARNALIYMFRCIREDTGIDLSYDDKKNAYLATVPAARTVGKKNAAPKVSPETDGRTIAANQAAMIASAADKAASMADDAANDSKAAGFLAALIASNPESVLLALASAYPDRESMIEAVMMMPVGAFAAKKDAA